MIYSENLLRILKTQGMLTAKITDLVEERLLPSDLKKLCKKVCAFEAGVSKTSPCIIYFQDTFWCGADKHVENQRGDLILDNSALLTNGRFQKSLYSPRFIVTVFNFEKLDVLEIPMIGLKRGRRRDLMKKVGDILGDLLRDVFDDEEEDHINDLLRSKNQSLYGMIIFGFTNTKNFPIAISGSMFEILSSGVIIHYIATKQDLVYGSDFKKGHDNKPFKARGLGKVMVNIIY